MMNNTMTKIMSVSLIIFLFYNNQVVCSENGALQQISKPQDRKIISMWGGHNYTHDTLDHDVKIKILSNSDHNCLELNVLSLVKKIKINFEQDADNNSVILNIPSGCDTPKIKCSFAETCYQNNVKIYSFDNDWDPTYKIVGDGNCVCVLCPFRLIATPSTIALLAGIVVCGAYKMILGV